MKVRKVIRKPIRVDREGLHIVGGVNAVISANVEETGSSHSHVSSSQHVRIVQRRGGRTEIHEEQVSVQEGDRRQERRRTRRSRRRQEVPNGDG